MTAQPTVSFPQGSSLNTFIGTAATLTLRFDNTAAAGEVGYAPYVNLILPTNGADGAGAGNSPANDGIGFVSATYLGMALESWQVEFNAAGQAVHPFLDDATGMPLVLTGTPGQTLLVLRLPFGSFTAGQTAADIALTLSVSEKADLGTPLAVQATGGFAYGSDPFDNACCDPPISGAPATLALQPGVAELVKTYLGPEQETATGPSYPREWVVEGRFAPGQGFSNVTLTDTMPDGTVVLGAHLEINGAPVPGGSIATTVNADGTTTLVGSFPGSITGGSDVPKMVIAFYVAEFLHDGTPVLDPVGGNFRQLHDQARLDADWNPTDGRDPDIHLTLDPPGPENSITAKSIAVQKEVALLSPAEQPQGVLEYRLAGQVSNYFEMQGLVLKDRLGDGQSFDAGFAPVVEIRENGVLLYSGAVTSYTVGTRDAAGETPVTFDISQTLQDAGFDRVLDGNGGGVGEASHAADYQQATVLLTFRSRLDLDWTGTVPGDGQVDQGDAVANEVLFGGEVYISGAYREDDSSAGITLPVSEVGKSIYAVNGDTGRGSAGFASPAHVQSGDLITYRLTLDMPLTSAHSVTLTDFLPLPVLRAADSNADGVPDSFLWDGMSGAIPGAGHVAFGPADEFHGHVPGVTPTLSVDPVANALTIAFGDVLNAGYPATHLDLLFTVRVGDAPFGDGLYLTNQVTSSEANSANAVSEDNAIIQFVLGEPRLKITKGVIGTDNPDSALTAPVGPVGFTAPGSGGPRFSGTISSAALDATPVNADLARADAGDTVSFAIILENKGQGWKGAFDTLVRDTLPPGFTIPPGGLNLTVTYGDGTSLPFHLVGGGLFDAAGGLMLDDASLIHGCIGTYDPASGRNVVVITYDLVLEDTVQGFDNALTNTASIVGYAAEEGGVNRAPHDGLADADTANLSILPVIGKAVTATSLAQTGSSQGHGGTPDLAIGEEVTYTITVRLPEGVSRDLRVEDLLPSGNGQIKALSATVTGIGGNLSGAGLVLGQGGTLSDSNGDGVADRVRFDFGDVANAADNATGDGQDSITIQVVGQLTQATANAAGDVLTNTARVSALNPDDPGARVTLAATADIEVVEPHLAIEKSVSPGTADAGDSVTYTVVLTNRATGFDAPAFDVAIADLLAQLPPNAQYQAGTLGILAGPAGTAILTGNAPGDTAILVTAPRLDPGESIAITFQARLDELAVSGQAIPNTATGTASSLPGMAAEERGTGVSDGAQVTIAAPVVTKSIIATSYDDTGTGQYDASRTDLKANEIATYRLVITVPEGSSPDFRVIDSLADTLVGGTSGGLLHYVPGSAKVVSAGANLASSLGSMLAPGILAADSNGNLTHDRITLSFGDVTNLADNVADARDQIVIELQARAADVAANAPGDVLGNSAVATSAHATSNTATASADFVQPKLSIEKSTGFATGDAGDLVTYTVVVRHAADSSSHAYNLVLGDLLPAGLQLVAGSATASAGTVNAAGGQVTLTLASYTLGAAPVTLTYQARLAQDVVDGQSIANTASLDYTTDPAGDRALHGSDTAMVAVDIQDSLAKTVTATSNPSTTGGQVAVGETITYLITATLGEGGQHLLLRDVLPAGLTHVSSAVLSLGGVLGSALGIGDAGSYDAGSNSVSFDFGEILNPGDNVTGFADKVMVQVVAQVAAGASGALVNTATLLPTTPANPYGVPAGTGMGSRTASQSVSVVVAAVGDRAFHDLNGNGVQDGGEGGVGGVLVRLVEEATGTVVATTTTAADGTYLFSNLIPGTYHEEFVAPAGWAISPQGQGTAATDSDADPATGIGPSFTLTNNQTDRTRDIGLYRPVEIGNRAWLDADGDGVQDAGEAGLAGVSVTLLNGLNQVVASATTDAGGHYLFSGLAPGQYQVQFGAIAGFHRTAAEQGGDDAADSDADAASGKAPARSYASGDSDHSIDAGYYRPASIGDRAWLDADGDGVQDAGEAGLAGVVVRLYDAGNTLVATAITDADGAYSFTGLRPGTYRESFEAPAGHVLTRPGQGSAAADSDAGGFGATSGSGPAITLLSGQEDQTHDAGFYQPVSIGDRVFADTDGDGVQDAGEPGIAGATVRLLDGSGAILAIATTDANGQYRFAELPPGDYQVQFLTPDGHSPSAAEQGGDDAADSDAVAGLTPLRNYPSGTQDGTVDAGFHRPVTIGDHAFEDMNGNGIQDAGDRPLAGVTVTLYNGTTGALVATAVTGADGGYRFTVPPGSYTESFSAPLGYLLTKSGQGSAATDSDPGGAHTPTGTAPGFVMQNGQTDLTHDAGFYRPVTIGDRVFEDQNGNGVQDAGDTSLAGVTVRLLDGSDQELASTTTDANGFYSFGNLPPGQYRVQVVAPPGYRFTTPEQGGSEALDSDADAAGLSPLRSYLSGDADAMVDAGLWRPVTIGDRAWLDMDGDGVQGAGEPGLGGVTITLVNEGTGATYTTTTAADGGYLFTGLPPGTYHQVFGRPAGYALTRPGQGLPGTDSDPNPASGIGPSFSIASGQADLSRDAGYYQPGSIGGLVFKPVATTLCDGRMPDSVFAGVTVTLLDAAGAVVASTVSGADGSYRFDGLAPGPYRLQFLAPDGTAFIPQAAGTAAPTDSDVDPASGLTEAVLLLSGQDLTGWNAGLTHLAGTLADSVPLTLPGGNHVITAAPQHIALLGSAVVNLNIAGNVVLGGTGDLSVNANAGGQYLVGASGNNTLHMGPTGGGVAIGGTGSTVVEGSGGNDIIIGGCGPNNVQGLGGADLIIGGDAGDILEGNSSAGLILGGGGNDSIHAGGAGITLVGGRNGGTISHDAGVFSNLAIGDRVNGTGANTSFVYQRGDGVQWIENFNPAAGHRLEIYGHAAPVAMGTVNGYSVLYFGPDQAVLFNGALPLSGIAYHPEQDRMPGAFGDFQPLAPVLLGSTVTAFYGTQGDDIAIASDAASALTGHGGNDWLAGGAGDDAIDGGAGDNSLVGKAGQDRFTGHLGNHDSIDGGAGTDKVTYDFARAAATLSRNADGSWTVAKASGTDILLGIEKVQFSDGLLNLPSLVFNPAILSDPDFNGDGKADLLFIHGSGDLYQWQMDGTAIVGGGSMASVGAGWRVAAKGDFGADGRADILFRHDNGDVYLWQMEGTAIAAGSYLGNPGHEWDIAGAGDFNGDGKADILWRHASGAVYQWQMDGGAITAMGDAGNPGTAWSITGIGDFDGDGRDDILWRHDSGLLYLWRMDGLGIAGGGGIGSPGAGWQVLGVGDFNGDSKADILFRHEGGLVYQWQMDGTAVTGQGALGSLDSQWHVAAIDDYNGDGKLDIMWQHAIGALYEWQMDGTAILHGAHIGSIAGGWMVA